MEEKNGINIYHERLMDYYQHPRNAGHVEHADFSSGSVNPSCGDSVQFDGMVHDGIVTKIVFSGSGCVISQAASSMLAEYAEHKSIDELLTVTKDDMVRLIGVALGPIRLKCALLPLQALQQGLLEYKKSRE